MARRVNVAVVLDGSLAGRFVDAKSKGGESSGRTDLVAADAAGIGAIAGSMVFPSVDARLRSAFGPDPCIIMDNVDDGSTLWQAVEMAFSKAGVESISPRCFVRQRHVTLAKFSKDWSKASEPLPA